MIPTFEDLQALLDRSKGNAAKLSTSRAALREANAQYETVTATANAQIKAASEAVDVRNAEVGAARDALDRDRSEAHAAIDALFNSLTVEGPAPDGT